ncbi:MAG: thiamine pyrophosphate-dependent enzyme [Clostridium sp.]|nr:thiamine pyrophosphate-dependent enzyme [Clostridium sp.]MCM1460574.1 thiamine pyrophosphate-dependent enzyme [Bacteroides sp.]
MQERKQIVEFASGNEMATMAIKQIGYDLMGYYPITPSTQIAENLDLMKAEGKTDLVMIAAEGEHSAAGICYGAAVGGGRVVNATSANGLLYALEQFPVQSGTRYPMVMNVACRTVSGPLSIKGDHSDIMYMLNAGWSILFAHSAQQVYDFNIVALKLAETVRLPVVVAYDGFFTSHQKRRCMRFEHDEDVRKFIGEKKEPYPFLDLEHPITVGSYMNEPDLINNRYQLHLAMEEAKNVLPNIFGEYSVLCGRSYGWCEGYCNEDAETLLVLLGSSFDTATIAVDRLRKQGEKAGVLTLNALRPFPEETLAKMLQYASHILIADRQDSYGGLGGNLSMEIRAAMQKYGCRGTVKSLVYGLGGKDFYVEDAIAMFELAKKEDAIIPYYYGVQKGNEQQKTLEREQYFAPLSAEATRISATVVKEDEQPQESSQITKPIHLQKKVLGGQINPTAAMPKRLAPGHGACPGCGIPVNVNLLLRAIENPVVLLFQTGCGMIVTTPYPKTSFKVPYLHNLFQNGAATLSGLAEICYRKQAKGELPSGDIVFIMVTGDGGMDIGMGSALSTAMRGHRLLLFEYDNGGYMNTGYQFSYSTPKGAVSATSHVGKCQFGKQQFHKDMPQLMVAANIPYVATVAESNPVDFIKKAAKAADYAKKEGCAYVKAISACPLNWNDAPDKERKVIEAAVDCCYFPLYEVERGITTLSYNPQKNGKKISVLDWLAMMGRTKHLKNTEYRTVVESLQEEVDRRFRCLLAKSENPYL